MSPFLAQVQVINVAGQPAASVEATAKPPDESIRASVARLKDKALAQAAKEMDEAGKSLDEDEHEAHAVQPTPSKQRPKSSGGEDMVFASVPIVAIVFTFLYLIVRALMAPFTGRNRPHNAPAQVYMDGLNAEETALLEKLQRTLIQMESRVESLETILIDPARTKEKYGSKP